MFLTYNIKIKRNTLYPILILELALWSIESMAMIRYLMYKHKLDNIGTVGFLKLLLTPTKTIYASSGGDLKMPPLG